MAPKLFMASAILTLVFASGVAAQVLRDPYVSSGVGSYRFYKDVENLSIKVPTVVEVSFAEDLIERPLFAVFDRTEGIFEPSFFKQETLLNETPVSISPTSSGLYQNRMLDKDIRTYADFPLPNDRQGEVQLTLTSVTPIISSSLMLLLDNNVAMPTSIEIRASVDNQERIVVAKKAMTQSTINFPQTTSDYWKIDMTFSQPLRISELRLIQDNAKRSSTRTLRFLAQPGHAYRIYFDPDKSITIPVREMGNLASAKEVLAVKASQPQNNPNYVIADSDNDDVPDIRDNCISHPNTDQLDVNGNGRGDVCDDFDQDGRINSQDNCPNHPNLDQKDRDSDGSGDVCDKEESRVTERYPWIPWVGIGFAALVLATLFILTARAKGLPKGGEGSQQE